MSLSEINTTSTSFPGSRKEVDKIIDIGFLYLWTKYMIAGYMYDRPVLPVFSNIGFVD
jgi:hypothetical protein